jgi:hypothetical protein
LTKGLATAVFASAVTAAVVERHEQAGRTIATASTVPLGAVLGMDIGMAIRQSGKDPGPVSADIAAIGGAIAGGLVGGLTGHALAASPGARAPVTAVALAPLYLAFMLAASFD